MVNSLPCVAPAKAPPAQQHVQGESLQSITSSLQSTACFVAPCPVGNLEASPLFSKTSRTLTQQNISHTDSYSFYSVGENTVKAMGCALLDMMLHICSRRFLQRNTVNYSLVSNIQRMSTRIVCYRKSKNNAFN